MKKSQRVDGFSAQSLELRLSGYSALGAVAALGAASSAAGQIVTTTYTTSATVPGSGASYSDTFLVGPAPIVFSAGHYFHVVGLSAGFTSHESGNVRIAANSTQFALNFAQGAPIAAAFNTDRGYAFKNHGGPQGNFIPAGPTVGGYAHASGYVGFRFNKNSGVGSTQPILGYGWIHITVTADGAGNPMSIALSPGQSTGGITGAYEAIGDGTITAGQTVSAIPEPATVATGLALFALRAVGVREHRRRRKLAA